MSINNIPIVAEKKRIMEGTGCNCGKLTLNYQFLNEVIFK